MKPVIWSLVGLCASLLLFPLMAGAQGPVLQVDFEGNFDDGSPTGADGVGVGGIGFSAAISGLGADFDGVDDSVTFPTFPDALLSSNDFSISFWFDLPVGPPLSVVSKRGVCNAVPFVDVRADAGRMRLGVSDGNATFEAGASYGEGWHHFTGIRRGSIVRVYLDGALASSVSTGTRFELSNTVDLGIGTSACVGVDGTQRLFGSLDELRIYDRALSEEEVYALWCASDPDGLCLSDSRFRVEADWRDFSGNTGTAKVVPFGSDDSGLLWFFNPDNWEMLVKVLDGCGFNDRFWVFAAATTNVEYTLRVTDTATGQVSAYFNPLGMASPAITDTDAFATCP